jgi:hypothetical protein
MAAPGEVTTRTGVNTRAGPSLRSFNRRAAAQIPGEGLSNGDSLVGTLATMLRESKLLTSHQGERT